MSATRDDMPPAIGSAADAYRSLAHEQTKLRNMGLGLDADRLLLVMKWLDKLVHAEEMATPHYPTSLMRHPLQRSPND